MTNHMSLFVCVFNSDMKDQIKEMDRELEQYHKSNAALDLMIGELRQKLDGMQRTIMSQRQRQSDLQSSMRRPVQTALHFAECWNIRIQISLLTNQKLSRCLCGPMRSL